MPPQRRGRLFRETKLCCVHRLVYGDICPEAYPWGDPRDPRIPREPHGPQEYGPRAIDEVIG